MDKIVYNDLFDSRIFEEMQKLFEKAVENMAKASAKEAEKAIQKLKSLNIEAPTFMGDLAKETELLNTKIAQQQAEINKLTKLYSDAANASKRMKDSTDAQKDSIKALQEENKRLQKEYEANSAKLEENTAKIKANNIEIDRQKKAFKAAINEGVEYGDSLNDLSKKLNALKNQYKALSAAERENINVGGQLQRQIQDIDRELKQAGAGVGEFQRNVGDYRNAIKEALAGGVQASGSGLLSGIVSGASAGSVGLVVAGVSVLVAKVVELSDGVQETNKQLNETANLTGQIGTELDKTTANIKAISTAFKQDFSETLKTTNSLIKTFGLNSDEATSLIVQGFISGGDASKDLLDQLAEYDVQFKDAGIAATDFVDILVRGQREGILSDKTADLVKEFGFRIREQAKATKDALNAALGEKFTSELFKGLNNGSINTIEAMRKVVSELQKVGVSGAKLQTVIADVFGAVGEDVGNLIPTLDKIFNANGKLIVSSKDLGKVLTENSGLLTEAQEKQLKTFILTQEQEQANVRLANSFKALGLDMNTLSMQISTTFTNAFAEAIEFINETAFLLTKWIEQLGFSSEQVDSFSLAIEESFLGLFEAFKYIFGGDLFQDGIRVITASLGAIQAAIANFATFTGNTIRNIRAVITGDIGFTDLLQNIKNESVDFASTITGEFTRIFNSLQVPVEKQAEKLGEAVATGTKKGFKNSISSADTRQAILAEMDALSKDLANAPELSAVKISIPIDANFGRKTDKSTGFMGLLGLGDKEEQEKAKADFTQFADEIFQISEMFGNAIFEGKMTRIQNEMAALEQQKQQELYLVGTNKEAQMLVEKRFAEQQKALRIKQAKAEKASRLFSIAIDTAAAITKSILISPATFGAPFSIFAAAQGALQAGLVAAQPLPAYKKGGKVDAVSGAEWNGTEYIDGTVGRGEFVMPVEQTMRYLPILEAMRLNKEVPSATSQSVVVVNADMDAYAKRIEKAIANQTNLSINIDKAGMIIREKRQNTEIQYQNSRYKR